MTCGGGYSRWDYEVRIGWALSDATVLVAEDAAWLLRSNSNVLITLPKPRAWFRCQNPKGWVAVYSRPAAPEEIIRYDDEFHIVSRRPMPANPESAIPLLRDFRGLDQNGRLIVKGDKHSFVVDLDGPPSTLELPFQPISVGFNGRRGLADLGSDRLYETADYGHTWTEVLTPGWREPTLLGELSCAPEGCDTAWGYRWGWLLR